ncbi:neutral zinc metallopeptidase [Fulvimarina sp. 2208YS6-2-32]|uniref:Neutral zinc metallopeptidase n=1 Tax=Fulvimarina uroteuthidis TaxID=3098149 RepID=A0ABU5HY66_9HYPH|nr:neutral zinc metallopeptidase [Fulvimarina sp. 2208YS6-2-32]MDY8107906.1 neutral zinc metallopeptidase [Fulvimarina sp. 2208YS6-2-32]
MQWRGRRQSSNIEDRRGSGGGFSGGRRGGGLRIPVKAGGGGIVTMLIVGAIAWFVFGINPLTLFGGDMGGQGSYQTSETGRAGGGVDSTPGETDNFVATVLADTETVWSTRFQEAGETYPEPTLVLFNDRVESACGIAGSATGPFYCPGDRKLYIDLTFFDQLESQLGAPGDFAQAYVVAHEVGHHIQNITGVLGKLNSARQSLPQDQANALSVRVELQADCYAGIWAHDTRAAGYVEPGDIDEALNAAFQIGDDTLQRRGQGTVVPDSFTHGTSAQRQEWFKRGYQSGNFGECDTLQGQL